MAMEDMDTGMDMDMVKEVAPTRKQRLIMGKKQSRPLLFGNGCVANSVDTNELFQTSNCHY